MLSPPATPGQWPAARHARRSVCPSVLDTGGTKFRVARVRTAYARFDIGRRWRLHVRRVDLTVGRIGDVCMASQDSRKPPSLRIAALVVGAAVLLASVWQAWLLHTDAAPFHQPYLTATPSQDTAVTLRMPVASVGIPLAAVILVLAAAGSAVARRWRACARVIGVGLLLVGLHGCYVRLRLPYGFGSGYEHASAAQHLHMTLGNASGAIGIILAVGLLAVSLIPRRASLTAPESPRRPGPRSPA